jgi:Protein of unknown function (DUF2796)
MPGVSAPAMKFAAIAAAASLAMFAACGRPAPSAETAPAAPVAAPPAVTIAATAEAPAVPDLVDDLELDDAEGHGAAAHEHGRAALAAALDGKSLTVAVESPLANFGLAETVDTASLNAIDVASKLITLVDGASCTRARTVLDGQRSGDHGSVLLTAEWTCSAPQDLSGVTFSGFGNYPGFELLDAIYAGPDSQNAAILTADEPTLIFD